MRNVTLAFGSFIVGAAFAFLLGNHTSILPHSVLAQTTLLNIAGAEPVVSTLVPATVSDTNFPSGLVLQLDGIHCVNCAVLPGGILRYSGGPFIIENFHLANGANIDFKGAAANTFSLLTALGLVGCPAPPHTPAQPNRPGIQTATTTTHDIKLVAFTSPVGVKQ